MDANGFISDTIKCRPIMIGVTHGFGRTQQEFFRDFYLLQARHGPLSAYRMRLLYERLGRRIAYKNVRAKLMALKKARLIESTSTRKKHVPKGLEWTSISVADKRNVHAAKYYRISTCGLLHLIKTEIETMNADELILTLEQTRENDLMKAILWKYFEADTMYYLVKNELHIPLPLAEQLRSYLRECIVYVEHFIQVMSQSDGRRDYLLEVMIWYLENLAHTLILQLFAFLHSKGPVKPDELREVKKVFDRDSKYSTKMKTILQKLQKIG